MLRKRKENPLPSFWEQGAGDGGFVATPFAEG